MPMSRETLPAELYRSNEAYEREIDTVFRRSWACAGRSEYVDAPGSYRATEVAGQNIVIVRDHDGTLRAFHNVCRHRGALLCDAGTGTLKRAIKCPYHSWVYGLDGELIGTPRVSADEIDRSQYGLHGMPVAEWQGILFVDLGGQAGPFEDYIASHDDDALGYERFGLGALRIVQTTTLDVAGNWKIWVENFRECLHCPTVHPELVDLIPAYRAGRVYEADPRDDGGVFMKSGASALTFSGASAIPTLPGLTEEEASSVYGAHLFPNCMLDVSGNYATLTTLLPRSATSTTIVSDYLLPPDVIADASLAGAVQELVDFMETVTAQDAAVVERTQQGISSRAFERGVYPDKDAALFAFNQRYRSLVNSAE